MAKVNNNIQAFNGGEIGKEVIGRTSLENYPNTAAMMENWLPEVSGPMSMRPGFEFLNGIAGDPETWLRHFTFSVDQAYMMLFSLSALRIAQDGKILVRPAVSAAVAGGTFPTLAAWTDVSEPGSTAAATGGQLILSSNGVARASVRQQITGASPGVLHAFRIVISRGTVLCRIGTTAGGDELMSEQSLRTGTHSLAVTPPGATIWIEFSNSQNVERRVVSVAIEAAGDLVLPTPYPAAVFESLRFHQVGDVVFVVSGTTIHRRIERRSANSWSFVEARTTDGPFLPGNLDTRLTLTPNVVTGNGTLTASKALFEVGHVGALFSIVHKGQSSVIAINGPTQWSDPIKVTGVGTTRNLFFRIYGTFVASVKLQRSVGNMIDWQDISTFTAPTVQTYNDAFDNQIMYYRMGVDLPAQYTSGTVNIDMTYASGSEEGLCRIISVLSPTAATMEVITDFSRAVASNEWKQSAFSGVSYWPSAVTVSDGRLVLADQDQFWASESDNYEGFKAGSAASDAIKRSVATGDMNRITWLMDLTRLFVGTAGAVAQIRASALDGPITPTDLTVRDMSTIGCANVAPAKVDNHILFIDRTGWRAYSVGYNPDIQDFSTKPMMRLHRKLGKPGIKQIAVQRQPETRIYMVRRDGQCLVLLFDPNDNAVGWARIVTDGFIESVGCTPADGEDQVYFIVRRKIGSVYKRYFERMDTVEIEAAEDASRFDSYIKHDGAPITVMTGLAHLEGETVGVWADGGGHADKVVTGGQITLARPSKKVCVGIPYSARYMSSKLAVGAQAGTAINQMKKPTHLAVILMDSVVGGLRYGTSFAQMDALADRFLESTWDAGPGLFTGETNPFPVPTAFQRDNRLCLEADSRTGPKTVVGIVLGQQTNEKI
jgi:hypothetical protein